MLMSNLQLRSYLIYKVIFKRATYITMPTQENKELINRTITKDKVIHDSYQLIFRENTTSLNLIYAKWK